MHLNNDQLEGDVTADTAGHSGSGGGGGSRPSSTKRGRAAKGGGGDLFEEGDGISASEIYGLEHLVRMLAALPSMMGPVSGVGVVVVV